MTEVVFLEWLSAHGLEILAIALSPLIALQISANIERGRDEENRKAALLRDEENRKLYALQTLLATRHSPFADDRIRTLNMVDVLFQNDDAVRKARHELMKSLSKPPALNPDGTMDKVLSDEWNERQWDLVSSMAEVLKVPITKDDFASGYAPKALGDMMAQQALVLEFNRTMIMFARNELGLPWNPLALYKMPDDMAVFGQFKVPRPQQGGEKAM